MLPRDNGDVESESKEIPPLVANDTLVKKLNLSYIKHLRPYRLQWLNECGEVFDCVC